MDTTLKIESGNNLEFLYVEGKWVAYVDASSLYPTVFEQ